MRNHYDALARADRGISRTPCFPRRLPPDVLDAVRVQPGDLEVADRAAAGERQRLGLGRLLHRPRVAAPAPARTSGTTRRRCRTCSRAWSARCASRNWSARWTSAATSTSAPRCPTGRPATIIHAAADGQLGGIMKLYRDWHICGDTRLAAKLVSARQAQPRLLHRALGPRRRGALVRAASQHLRHRVLGAGRHVRQHLRRRAYRHGGDGPSPLANEAKRRAYGELAQRGASFMDDELFNGEYYEQKVQWGGLARPVVRPAHRRR